MIDVPILFYTHVEQKEVFIMIVSPGEAEATIDALTQVLKNKTRKDPLAVRKQRLEDAVVQIKLHRRNRVLASHGLLLTSNGLVLTVYHSIKKQEQRLKSTAQQQPQDASQLEQWLSTSVQPKQYVVDQEHQRYAIDPTFWYTHPAFDLTIIKAVMPRTPEPIGWCYDSDKLPYGTIMERHSLDDEGNMQKKTGKMKESKTADFNDNWILDSFLRTIPSEPGSSGSPISVDGRLVGIGAYSSGKDHYGGAKVKYALPLIKAVRDDLKDMLRQAKKGL